MCDVKKYYNIFQDLNSLSQDDTLQLILGAETQEEKEFFAMLGNFLLKKRQRKVIERNLF